MNFLFYFYYRIFKTYDKDPSFTAILAVFITFCLYLLSIHKILFNFGYVSKLPVFSNTYLFNKLRWMVPVLVLFVFFYMFFTSDKRQTIIQRFNKHDDFFSFGSIFLFVLIIGLPIFLIAHFSYNK
jgi:hypothetical protein